MQVVSISEERKNSMVQRLKFLYGNNRGEKLYRLINDITLDFLDSKDASKNPDKGGKNWITERDIILITYGDQIRERNREPLEALENFLVEYMGELNPIVHLLPFYPYSSDDGFSVIDYFKVNPDLGKWQHIEKLSNKFDLMFDAVINHISAESEWFEGYLEGKEEFKDFFIEMEPNTDISTVTRPRDLPLFTKFKTNDGEKHLWTTFSKDQIDLNYKNERVLLSIINLLLFYINKGARFIRLDAVGYLWKKLQTSCIHLKETHMVIQLFRDIFEVVAPNTVIITETNVPHRDNISYFGDGYNEAHMVYQFPLPPLTLHAISTGNASYLSTWADSLESASEKTTYFNFLASHDGIGIMPSRDILPNDEIEKMIIWTKKRGGRVSYKSNGDGSKSVYELNINYFNALSDPGDEESVKIQRFLCSQSILLTLKGVPGIYIHSLLGSRNYSDGVEKTGRSRSINREKLEREGLEAELNTPEHLRHKVFYKYKKLIGKRMGNRAFHPIGIQKVIHSSNRVFGILRIDKENTEAVMCLHNVSNEAEELDIDIRAYTSGFKKANDILSTKTWDIDNGFLNIELKPYEFVWIRLEQLEVK